MGASLTKEQQLKIKILTGETQSQQLFDFHSPQKQELSSDLSFPSIIGLKDGDLIYLPQTERGSADVQPLYRIERKDKRCFTIRELFQRSNDGEDSYIWKVLAAGEEMSLEEGDEIKIGKTKITFKELVATGDEDKQPYAASKEDTSRTVLPSPQELRAKDTEDTCRVCFQAASTPQNPLVSLCKCKGSVKFIHFECLKDWRFNSVKRDKSPNCLFYSYTEPDCCELCKEPLKNQFECNGQTYNFCQIEKLDPPYAVFENRTLEEQTGKTRVSVYALSVPENNEVTIGRNHSSKVVLRDISVSRSHCFLVLKQGRLFIQDKKSKFGTLVRTKRGVEFDSQCGLQLQFQSRLVQISQSELFSGCCLAESSSYLVEINKAINEPAI